MYFQIDDKNYVQIIMQINLNKVLQLYNLKSDNKKLHDFNKCFIYSIEN